MLRAKYSYLILLVVIGATAESNLCMKGIKMSPFDLKIGENYYWIQETTKVNWYKAVHICRASGGMLVSIDSAEEHAAINDYLVANGHNNEADWFWTSGNDLGQEGQYHWLRTGKKITYSNWTIHQPDNGFGAEHCAHLWKRFGWYSLNDWTCNGEAYFICQANDFKSIYITGVVQSQCKSL